MRGPWMEGRAWSVLYESNARLLNYRLLIGLRLRSRVHRLTTEVNHMSRVLLEEVVKILKRIEKAVKK